ncbi:MULTISPECIES: methyl-accepting chemotaxis protein [unclassified Paenibacillus]|uniref:methyl-accepting chemotaxis protein n=1 Tax=unclassified Paenibacillus TaxID=185978 RepID=UPI000956A7DE|nr:MULTISPECIES: methyl-accepting chemotaxis protein [unclassified Paenibacillus]ASS67457.1 methyl-accepting chemotaxis protein [Paenibacillus sp. RUD330]SIQ76356.1 methyl-accepting chemotaxis protein [Paenibacillus sp. RU4X]SIQ97776.1 methyl-accepting chemotaxis protein [Paenibacillus sp. RU4T]
MKIRTNLLLGFSVVLALTLLVGAVSWQQLHSLHRTYESLIQDRVGKILLTKDLKYGAASEAKNVRGYLITGQKASFDAYEADRHSFAEGMKELQGSLQQEKAQELASQLERLESEYAGIVATIAGYKQRGDTAGYTKLVEEQCIPMALKLSAAAEELELFQHRELASSQAEAAGHVADVQKVLAAAVVLALLFGAAAALVISRRISRPVDEAAGAAQRIAEGDLTGDDLAPARIRELNVLTGAVNGMKQQLRQLLRTIDRNAGELAASSRRLAGASSKSASESERISLSVRAIAKSASVQRERMDESRTAMEESALSLQRVAEAASITAESSELALQQADLGSRLMSETKGRMEEIRVVMEGAAGTVGNLVEQSGRIKAMAAFIHEVASQTNLLSLNASIEAARAGESGRGFAVVAREVKQLSEETREASARISEFVLAIAEHGDQAVESVNKGMEEAMRGTESIGKTEAAFRSVADSLTTVAQQTQEVSASSEQLSASMEQMLASSDELLSLASTIAEHSGASADGCGEQLESMQDISRSAESLQAMAALLQEKLDAFRVEEEPALSAAESAHPRTAAVSAP